MPQNYVIGVALSADLSKAICLQKRKGPSDLIGKWTFPGGKVDPHEEPNDIKEKGTPDEYFKVMSREFKEETGISVPSQDWVSFGFKTFDDGSRLYLFGVVLSETELASVRTMEEEEVKVLGVGENKDLSLVYTVDFDQLVGIVKHYWESPSD